MRKILINNNFSRQQVDNPDCNSNTSNINTNKIPQSGPYYRYGWFKRMCINDCGDCIRRVMKTIDEFECCCSKQAEQKHNGKPCIKSKHKQQKLVGQAEILKFEN